MFKLIFVLVLSLFMCGCHTIIIKNGDQEKTSFNQEEWHQIGIIDLVEYSSPVDLQDRCGAHDWSSVQTKQSVGQVFLGLVPYMNIFWAPHEVAITCSTK